MTKRQSKEAWNISGTRRSMFKIDTYSKNQRDFWELLKNDTKISKNKKLSQFKQLFVV